jgi:hypothetical protein
MVNIMKKVISLLAVSLLLVSCQEKIDVVEINNDIYTASVEEFSDASTKTALSSLNVVWSENDAIAIFDQYTIPSKYQVSESSVGTTKGRFSPISIQNEGNVSGYDNNIAVYPYEEDLVCNVSEVDGNQALSYTVSDVAIPTTQTYVENSFANGTYLMAAVTSTAADKMLAFKNVCGVIKLQLKGNCSVKSIKLEGNSSEKLSGQGTLTVYVDGSAPVLSLNNEAQTHVTLDCGAGVALDENEVTDFYLTVPPTPFSSGFKVTVTDTYDNKKVISTDKPNAVNRSRILVMPPVTVNVNTIIEYSGASKIYVNPEAAWEKTFTHEYDPLTSKGRLVFDGKITYIPSMAFHDQSGQESRFIPILYIPKGITSIRGAAFINRDIGEIAFPSTLREIGANAFVNCNFIGPYPFDFPEGLQTIGDNAFAIEMQDSKKDCDMIIPQSVTYVGANAFQGRSLDEITINCAEFDYSALKSVVVNRITSYARRLTGTESVPWQCTIFVAYQLQYVTAGWIYPHDSVHLMCPPPATNISSGYSGKTIHVSPQYKSDYQSTPPWNDFTIQ